MRRLLSIAMTLLFGLTLAAPLLAVDSTRELPECCRRSGRHHCAAGMQATAADRAVSGIAPKCPSFPKATTAPYPNSLACKTAAETGIPLYTHPASSPQTEARYRVSSTRSRQKRGPPALSLQSFLPSHS